MSIARRCTVTTGEASLAGGRGRIEAGSGAWYGVDVTGAARSEQPGGNTSPQELAAAAHSTCSPMGLGRLGKRHVRTQRPRVQASVTLDEADGKPTVVSSVLQVQARVDGLDSVGFRQAVVEAAALCPVSRLFTGVRIGFEAQLEPADTAPRS